MFLSTKRCFSSGVSHSGLSDLIPSFVVRLNLSKADLEAGEEALNIHQEAVALNGIKFPTFKFPDIVPLACLH